MEEPQGFESFVAARGNAPHRTAVLLTHDHALAEDLVQTALAKSWTAWRRIEGEPEPYVRKVMLNTYSSWWQRKWRGEQPTERLPERPADQPTGSTDDRDALVRALAALPHRQRAVIVLRFVEDLTERQAAEQLGGSVGTVKSQTAKALAKLRVDPQLTPEGAADVHFA